MPYNLVAMCNFLWLHNHHMIYCDTSCEEHLLNYSSNFVSSLTLSRIVSDSIKP